MRILHEFQAHDGAINAMCMDTAEESLFTGSSDGTIKVRYNAKDLWCDFKYLQFLHPSRRSEKCRGHVL
jgi:WD40 repeat protein